MKDLLLFPFNGNAKEALSAVQAINRIEETWNVVGFIDDDSSIWGHNYYGYKVLGGRAVLKAYPDAKILAVPGRPENFKKRDEIINSLGVKNDRFATIIHPLAQIGLETKIGYNTLLLSGVVTTVNVTIGNSCAILPNTVLSHDVLIGDFCLIGSNVSISGGVCVEDKCYIGTGAKIIQEIKIAGETLVGIGSVVLRPTSPGSVVVGNPARMLEK